MNDCEYEKRTVTVRTDNGELIQGEISYCEFIRDKKDWCHIILCVDKKTYESVEEHYFTALQRIREQLESEKFQILCNGAARNVYPSAMMFDMGSAGIGYKLYMNVQAKMSDIVKIFEYDDSLDFVSVAEQNDFYDTWLKSFKG